MYGITSFRYSICLSKRQLLPTPCDQAKFWEWIEHDWRSFSLKQREPSELPDPWWLLSSSLVSWGTSSNSLSQGNTLKTQVPELWG